MNDLERLDPKHVVAGLVSGDNKIRTATAQNPSTVLAVIASVHNQGGTNLPVLARALDITLGLITSLREARKLLDAHLTPQAQAEMLATHGDLPSVMVEVADPAVIVASLEFDASKAKKKLALVSASLLALAWAQNAQSRKDWEEILEQEIGETSFRDLLIAAVYAQRPQGDDEADPDISPDQWVDVGLEPIDAAERLQELLVEGTLPQFSALDIEQARKRLYELQKIFQKDSSSETMSVLAEEIEI